MTKGMSKSTQRALREAPADGVITVEYSVGLAIKRRGMAEEIRDRSGDDRRFPKMTLKLNEVGLIEGGRLRGLQAYQDRYNSTTAAIDGMVEAGADIFHLAATAGAHLDHMRASNETAPEDVEGQRGYVEALRAYCRELVGL